MNIVIKHRNDVVPERGSCGSRRPLITAADSPGVGLSEVSIADARAHYHPRCTEIYFVQSGRGVLELDGKAVPLEEGTTVLIPPGVRHMAKPEGELRVLVVMAPATAETTDIVYVDGDVTVPVGVIASAASESTQEESQ